MDKMKQWIALTLVGALAIMAGGWFLVISPKRAHAADLRTQAAAKERANSLLQVQLSTLKAQAKDLPKQQAKLAAVAAKIPNNSAMPTLIRALNSAADDTGVELVSVAPSVATPVAGAAAPAAATTAASAASAPSSVGALQSIQLSLGIVGSYFQVAEYLDRLESLQRAFRVTGFTLAPGTNPVKSPASQPGTDTGKLLNASITGLVFESTGATSALAAGK
jgi:Tfp pilus assembly protein PilO